MELPEEARHDRKRVNEAVRQWASRDDD